MKRNPFKLIILIILFLAVSCDEPETTVINFVHPDGSVTRKIEMRNSKKIFETAGLQVPFDSTWIVQDSLEINVKGDTTWIKRAEKLFKTADEINQTYQSDSGANKDISRRVIFTKKFRWFTTIYRFSEMIDKDLIDGYPIANFLNREELMIFYSPESIKAVHQSGPDSLKYRAVEDKISKMVDRWMSRSLISECIGEFTNLIKGKAGNEITKEMLKDKEDEIVRLLETSQNKFDSLWSNGILLKEFIGEANARKYKSEADSAISVVNSKIYWNFKEYSIKILMPGRLIGTNGFADNCNVLLWPVKSDFFLTENYEMWAESRMPNIWTWIVSGLFLVFVITGAILKKKKG